jgi:hypothetical protein
MPIAINASNQSKSLNERFSNIAAINQMMNAER